MKTKKLISWLYRCALRSNESQSVIVNNKNDIRIIKSDRQMSPSINILIGEVLCISISTIEAIKMDYFNENKIGFYLTVSNINKNRNRITVWCQNGKTSITEYRSNESNQSVLRINEPVIHVKNDIIEAYINEKNVLEAIDIIFKKLKLDKNLAIKYNFPKKPKEKKVKENG